MAVERGSWRAALGVGWILVVGACSGGAENNVSAAPPPQNHGESTAVLDQQASGAPPAETTLPAEATPPGEMTPPADTLRKKPADSPAPAKPVQPLEPGTPDAGSAAGQDGSAPIDAAHPFSEPSDAGAPLSNDASSPVAVPEPPVVEPSPADAGAPPDEPPPPPPADAGAPPDEPPPPPPPPTPTSFETEVWPIFKARCSSCHGVGRAGGHSVGSSVLATAYADAQRLGSTLIDRLDGGGMPPACSGQPGDPGCIAVAELATIQGWLDTGMAP